VTDLEGTTRPERPPLTFTVTDLEVTDSTQAEVQRRAAAGAPEGTVVSARHQRAGRGRRGHEWWDAPGQSLLCSVLLRPTCPPATVPQLSLVGGLAVAEALAGSTGVSARIRWPNDLLVDERKVCGILAEAASGAGGHVHHVILGIGINLRQAAFPEPLADRATSLWLLTGRAPDASTLLAAVLARLGARYAAWQDGGFAALRAAWLAHSMLPGQVVRLPDGRLGRAEDVDPDGVLLARAGDGRRLRIVAGTAVEEGPVHAAGH
jgi:BirA family transcriptional regulator, biotin operon repressor / biotin---[acetyl-CoA-carboxylase] ligase